MNGKNLLTLILTVSAGLVGFFVWNIFGLLSFGAIGLGLGIFITQKTKKSKELASPYGIAEKQIQRTNTLAASILDQQVSKSLKSISKAAKKMLEFSKKDQNHYIEFQESLSLDLSRGVELGELFYKFGEKGLASESEKASLPAIKEELDLLGTTFDSRVQRLNQDVLESPMDRLEDR